jgi:hypothetical protein
MSRFANNPIYVVNGDMSSAATPDSRSPATIVGQWIPLEDIDALGVQVKWAGVATTGAFDVEVTNDNDPTGARGGLGPKAITRTADMTAANPGGGVSGAAFFTLAGANFPRAKWGRVVYTRSAGGSANSLQASINVRGT